MKNFFNRFLCNLKVRATHVAETAMSKKRTGIDGLLIAIILIVIVVGLLVLFKSTVVDKMTNSITEMGSKLDNLVATPTPAG